MQAPAPSDIGLRPPETVMRLDRLGAFHQTRLSFMRALLRRLKSDGWRFDRPVWEIDERGVGVAIYRASGPERTYSLVCFAHDLDPAKRSDRVIATEWDATFTLFDGVPDAADIARLRANVPLQEAGRITKSELSLSRANRSVRMFDHVVSRLSEGVQPDRELMHSVGYLMRTTAVYGSGKFGAADRALVSSRAEFRPSFHMEMLSVWLTRAFTVDIAEHLARVRAPETAVRMDPDLRRGLGVGNSTGLGMAPFLVNHPRLLHRWIVMREEALARVRRLPGAGEVARRGVAATLARVRANVEGWTTGDERLTRRIGRLREEARWIEDLAASGILDEPRPWNALYRCAEATLSLEGQELMVSLLLEPHGALIDDLAETVHCEESVAEPLDGTMTVCELHTLLADAYGWALAADYSNPGECARFWYVSEAKLEPRLGERFEEPGAERESPLAVGRDMAALASDLERADGGERLAEFLLRQPEHRHLVRRAQIVARHPYGEIRDNLIAADMQPIDILRCKLSFFGATNFDPRSDRWVRINMFRGAPFPDEFETMPADDWAFGGGEAG